MDMQVNRVLARKATRTRRAIQVDSREQLDYLIKEHEIATGQRGRRFHLPKDSLRTYLVTIDGHGYGVQLFVGTKGRSAELMSASEVDLFFEERVLLTWPAPDGASAT